MSEQERIDTLAEAYNKAIDDYKGCRRELGECEIDIDVARFNKNTPDLRQELSRRNKLLDYVNKARGKVQIAQLDIVRQKGMASKDEAKKLGLLHQIIEKIVKS